MTGISFFIKKLRNNLSEDTQPWVLSALRQDPIVWKSLHDSELSDQAIEILGSTPDLWTPANLSLISLGYEDPFTEVLEDQKIFEMTDLLLDSSFGGKQNIKETNELSQVGLFAITQVKRAQEIGSWEDLPLQLLSKSGEFSRSAMACLYGFAPDPQLLLKSILATSRNIYEICNFVIHAVLSNPLPIQEQEKVLGDLLKDLSLQYSNLFLQNLNLQRPGFANSQAKEYLSSQKTPKIGRADAHITEQVNILSEILLHAEINAIANLHSKTISLQSQALHSVNHLRSEIAAQLAGAEVAQGDIETALSTWQQSREKSSSPKQYRIEAPRPELLIALIESGNHADAMALLPETEMQDTDNSHPSQLIAAARLANDEGNSKLAKSFAKMAFQKIESWTPETTSDISEKAYSPRSYTQTNSAMVKLLTDLSLHPEVVKATRVGLTFQPNDIELLNQNAHALLATGDPSSATEAAYVAVSLSPDNENLRRLLITCLEGSGDWEAVVLERVALLDNRFSPGPDTTWPNKIDQTALAKAYLFAEQSERTIEICNILLQEDGQDGVTHALLGEAYMTLGKTEEAVDHLDKATQYSPHEPAPWMALARTQERTNNPEKALEILRSASYAVPLDPSIKLALAEKYLEDGEISQALPVLKEAHQLLIDTPSAKKSHTDKQASSINSQIEPKVSLKLGETLLELGYQTEALQVLESAYRKYPAYQGLAYSYAKNLLSLGDYTKAIPPLVIAVQAEEDELGPNLDYGRALLEVKTQPYEAVRALAKAAKLAPSDPIIRSLLAEALLVNGQAEEAMDNYSQVLESPLMNEIEWKSRILHGFSRTALALEKPDLAIASLQEAAQVDPQNPELFRTLTEAFSAAELTKEALKFARTAKQLAPDDVEMLIWYANILTKLNRSTDAIPALTRALDLSPNQPALLIQLGNVQSLAGEDKSAAHTYRKILMIENPGADELLGAAMGLHRIGDFINAIACVELGLEKLSEPEPEFLKQLALSYRSINQFDKALETLERACVLEPESIDLLIEKTDLLVLLERPQAAEASLEHALNVHPENIMLHEKLALFYRKTGNITKALSKAEELVAMHVDEPQSSDAFAARAFAAELARALLQHDYAISILENKSNLETIEEGATTDGEKTDPEFNHFSPNAVPYFCLLAEIALEHDEEVSAANHLTKAYKFAPNHPRVLALQSRLSKRGNDPSIADQTFASSLEASGLIEKNPNKMDIDDDHDISPSNSDTGKFHQEICNLMAVAEAAGEIKQWEKWFEILEMVTTLVPREPFIYLQLARALTLRAEYQDFCQKLGAINNTPGDIALTEDTYQTFKENLETAESQFKSAHQIRQLDDTMLIKRWKIRGDTIFQPNTQNPESLAETDQDADDFATLITSITKTKNITNIHNIYNALKENSDFQSLDHLALARVAHSLNNGCPRREDQEEAMTLIQAAIQHDSCEPLYLALLAKIAYKLGDNEVAIQAIDSALTSWPNEPRWHDTAATISISGGDISAAITHLKIAAELEPDHLSHQLALGECLQKNGEFRAAIQTLKSAQDIEPTNIEPVLGLARAYLSIGEYKQASSYAQSATTKAPNEITPFLVSAEVALQSGNLDEAQEYVETALRINSQNTEALKMNSQVLQALGRFDEALETLEQAIQLAEKPLKLMLERVDLVASTQGTKAALKNLQDLALEYPEEPDVLYHLAKALATGGHNETAILAAQKALRCDTFTLNPKELSQIHFLLGQLMRQSGQLDQAIYQLNKSIRLTPVYLEPYLELGKAHQERRQHALSLQTYQKAITMAPDDPRPYCQASLLLKESHDYQGAESMLRRAADLSPDDLSIHRQLGALIALNIVHNRRAIPKA